MEWYAVLFWIWLVVSVVILVLRRMGVVGGDRTTSSEPERADPLARTWAPPPPDPDAPVVAASPAPAPAVAAPTLADLLAGITLPHELVPLTQSAATADPANHLVVSTTRASAEAVTAGLAEELEGLGYTVSTTGPRTILAEGPRGQVAAEIHADGATVMEGGARRFPTAESGAVVVELRTGRSGGLAG